MNAETVKNPCGIIQHRLYNVLPVQQGFSKAAVTQAEMQSVNRVLLELQQSASRTVCSALPIITSIQHMSVQRVMNAHLVKRLKQRVVSMLILFF
tara:strand:+ start:127 stop:411 length:285 start_codon:yes stop_codon:yes gene_type:complete